jgi:predicted nucleic acid-binding protein
VNDVIDASVAAKWYFPEEGSRRAGEVLAEASEGRRNLLAPDLLVAEFTNILWKKIGLDECRPDEAQAILDFFETDRPRLVDSVALAPRALELALRLEHPVYDCLYLATAIEYDARLVTADARLARSARVVLTEVDLVRGA